MRMLSYVFETTLSFSEPVSDHSFVLRCLPKSTNTQKVMESQVFTHPRIPLAEQVDGFGNRIIVGYCPEAHDAFNFYATGIAMVEPEDAGPTPAHPMYLQTTRLTMPDDALRKVAHEVRDAAAGAGVGNSPACEPDVSRETSGGGSAVATSAAVSDAAADDAAPAPDAWALAQRLSARVFAAFEYAPGSTDTTTTAAEAFAGGRGVCQDYAHVLITLCRELGIPARYVTGLMVGEGATHAWVEVHDGERWRGVDPTHNCVVDDRYLLFSTGRDFEDCPIERGMFRGNAEQTQRVSASLGDDAPAVNATKFKH
ncbi:MAG: transglutaminase family protein [Eggerthellaceae bacterium]|nr:transglutaminase family protein [Eggerthellaceae bacterium]